MASIIDLRDGKIVIGERDKRAELSKAELLLARDSNDVNSLITSKIAREADQAYYFNRDVLFDGWECISGPKGLAEPQPADWPSAQRARARG